MKKLFTVFTLLVSFIMFSQDWKTNFQEAKNEAKENEKSIVLVFSGSDWCAPCIRLDKNVWQNDAFKSISETWVLVKADFPKRKANLLSEEQTLHNRNLAELYNKEGVFPLVVLFNSKGEMLTKFSYEGQDVATFMKKIESYTSYEK